MTDEEARMSQLKSREEQLAAADPLLEALDPERGRPSHIMEARALSLAFGDKPILTDLNVQFARGTITALIGPTGSGKSTFLRTLNRMNDKVPGFGHQAGWSVLSQAGQDRLLECR